MIYLDDVCSVNNYFKTNLMLKTSSIIIEGSCIGRDISIPFWPGLDLGVNWQSYFQDEIELAHPSHVRPFF
jgi:hypothetical protein